MLDDKTRKIVKACAPILQERGLEVTTHMYGLMFSQNPEVKALFNPANQTPTGQPATLARAVGAYAANIDNLDVLGGALKLMAHKHASLGVTADQYPIVGKHLLQSLEDVLGVDAETKDAWAKAYGFLADVLIGMERQLYDEAAAQEGGWRDFRRFRIAHKEPESDIITSFYLEPVDGKPVTRHRPGQYTTVRLDFPDGSSTVRNYSLSDAPNGKGYRISVKREDVPAEAPNAPQGAVSHWLHDQMEPGMELELRAPMGDFYLDTESTRPVVLLSGGVGQTPLLAMLKSLAAPGATRDTYFIHAARNSAVHALGDEVKSLTAQNPKLKSFVAYDEPSAADIKQGGFDKTGTVTAEWLASLLPTKDCDFYFCGPKPFMREIYAILKGWNVPSPQIRFEFFGPAGDIEAAA